VPTKIVIDLHIHSKTCSDGNLHIPELIREAKTRNISLMSITDHDTVSCQIQAIKLANKNGIHYLSGVELNITFSHPGFREGKPISLDLLGYSFDIEDHALTSKIKEIAEYRKQRAKKILENLNRALDKEDKAPLTEADWNEIQRMADGVIGRPHIADYLVKKGLVADRQEAFDRYLVKCNVPKYPLYLKSASTLIRNAGGIAVLAHPNDPHGTSLAKLTNNLQEQTGIIEDTMLSHLDGIECWHSRCTPETTRHYVEFAKKHGLVLTGGSDCHQKPIIMGTVKMPAYVAEQFLKQRK